MNLFELQKTPHGEYDAWRGAFAGVNFGKANLRYADLSTTDLIESTFQGADLAALWTYTVRT